MADPVELSVRSSLSKVIDELGAIRDRARETGDALKSAGASVGESMKLSQRQVHETYEEFAKGGAYVEEGLKTNLKNTERFFSGLRSLSRRVADQLRGDFKSLLAVNALTDSMKISNAFRQNVSETVLLSDTIRKLGATFGIAHDRFADFQTKITEGLGEIGLSSDVAARALDGLSKTRVRGEDQIIGYSQQAGMLASVGREKGREGDIAEEMATVIQARGGDVNDMGQVQQLAESLRRVLVETGAGPLATLRSMEQIFKNMPKDFREKITPAGLTNLAAASAVGGPNATKFLEEYLGKSPIARMAFDAQGGKGIFTEKGLDVEKFAKFSKGIMGRVGGDPRLAAQTLGLSEEAAEGFVRLSENLDKVKDAQERVEQSTGSLAEQYRSSMGLGEAFRANINRVKKALAEPLSAVTQKATDVLSSASESNVGAGVVAGGAALAAMALAGFGARGIGAGLAKGVAGMGGTVARKEAAEQFLGAKTIPVYVVNVDEFSLGGLGSTAGAAGAAVEGIGAAGAAGATGLGVLGGVGIIAGAGVAGGALGYYMGNKEGEKFKKQQEDDLKRNVISRVMKNPDLLKDPHVRDVYQQAVKERGKKTSGLGKPVVPPPTAAGGAPLAELDEDDDEKKSALPSPAKGISPKLSGKGNRDLPDGVTDVGNDSVRIPILDPKTGEQLGAWRGSIDSKQSMEMLQKYISDVEALKKQGKEPKLLESSSTKDKPKTTLVPNSGAGSSAGAPGSSAGSSSSTRATPPQAPPPAPPQKVLIELNTRDLKASRQPTRGASN